MNMCTKMDGYRSLSAQAKASFNMQLPIAPHRAVLSYQDMLTS